MDKVKLEYKIPKNKTIEYNDTVIEVKPVLSLAEQSFLINKYVEDYFFSDEKIIKYPEYDFFGAECNLINYVYQTCTNIDIEDFENDLYVDVKLWKDVISKIINFEDFRKKLDVIILDIKEEKALEKSVGEILNKASSELIRIINKFGDIKPEDISKAKDAGLELLKEFEKSSMNNVVSPISTNSKKKKKKE